MRIIPARAGPTPLAASTAMSSADHPRSCGANMSYYVLGVLTPGSSPLVRGQPPFHFSGGPVVRIIPARAGPTHVGCGGVATAADHPRSCGANSPHRDETSSSCGSSPLVRGQLSVGFESHRRHRIIPARAGPTDFHHSKSTSSPDHPRSCGANSLILRGKSGLSQIKIFDYSSGIWQ